MNERAVQILGAALVIVAGVWAGARIQSARRVVGADSGVPATATALPSTDGDVSGDIAPQPTRIPDRLPGFSLSNLEGKSTPIATWRGKSLVINFWATWCAPCRQEIPLLESLSAEWAGRGVQVIGIAVDHRDQVAAFARKLNIGYPLLIGEQDALRVAADLGFEAPVFPFTVFTDRRGEVVALYVGELHPPQASLILAVVQSLNEDHIGLKDARHSIADGLHNLGARKAS